MPGISQLLKNGSPAAINPAKAEYRFMFQLGTGVDKISERQGQSVSTELRLEFTLPWRIYRGCDSEQ